MDQRNNHLGSSMGFDHMSYGNGPQFTNPWNSGSSGHHTPQLYPNSIGSSTGFPSLKQEPARASTASVPYSSIPASAPLNATSNYSSYGANQLLDMSQDLLNHSRSTTYDQGYSTAPSSVGSYAPTSAPYVNAYGSVAQSQPQDEGRRLSHS